jgi:hypothetical protein
MPVRMVMAKSEVLKESLVAANAMGPTPCHIRGMAIYRVSSDIVAGTGFAAEVTFRTGHVETQGGFVTEAGALDWVGERLVGDVEPASEA